MKKAPCKDCLERKPHCHSNCDGYKHFQEELEKSKQYTKMMNDSGRSSKDGVVFSHRANIYR